MNKEFEKSINSMDFLSEDYKQHLLDLINKIEKTTSSELNKMSGVCSVIDEILHELCESFDVGHIETLGILETIKAKMNYVGGKAFERGAMEATLRKMLDRRGK